MFLKTRSAALAAVIAALAVPVASASAASTPVKDSGGLGTPRCPDGYVGPTNLATGCPWYLIH